MVSGGRRQARERQADGQQFALANVMLLIDSLVRSALDIGTGRRALRNRDLF